MSRKINPTTAYRFSRGFTLVEMLVSIAVFMSVMVVAAGSLVSIINENDKAQNIKSVVDNVTFAIDSISRNLRSGSDFSCIPTNGSSFSGDCSTGGQTIRYWNSTDGAYTEYRFVDSGSISSSTGNIQRASGCDVSGVCTTSWQSITAPTANVTISNMVFYVLGTTAGFQPRVLVTVSGTITSKDGTKTEFTMQTTASERVRIQ